MKSVGYPSGVARRFGALLYDALLILGIWMITLLIWNIAAGDAVIGSQVFAVQVLEAAAFYAYFWRTQGQTLGMRSWRIRLVDEAGNRPSWRQILIRLVIGPLSLLCAGLGYIWYYVGDRQQTWHDRASGTMVVHLPKEPDR